jgi:hypothetical protein
VDTEVLTKTRLLRTHGHLINIIVVKLQKFLAPTGGLLNGSKIARFNGWMEVARDERKLLKACRARLDFEVVTPNALPA